MKSILPIKTPADEIQLKALHLFLCAIGLSVVVVFLLSLPELKRYIKISTM